MKRSAKTLKTWAESRPFVRERRKATREDLEAWKAACSRVRDLAALARLK